MEIAFMVHSFPNTTGTFIQNQIIGLLDSAHNVSIFSELKPSEDIHHEKIQNYNLEDRTIYTSNPQSYIDGVRLLSTTIPSLLFNNEVELRTILTQLASGKTAPRKLANLDTVTQYGSFDAYHVHFGPTANSFLPLAAVKESPFIASFYGFDASKALREDPSRYDQLFDQADAITVLSEDMRSTVVDAGCPEAKTHIQPLSVDTELFPYYERTLDNGPVRLLTVARFVEKKGLVYALEAVASLADEYDIEYPATKHDLERRLGHLDVAAARQRQRVLAVGIPRTADESRPGAEALDREFAAVLLVTVGTRPDHEVLLLIGLLGLAERAAVDERLPAREHLDVREAVLLAGLLQEEGLTGRRQRQRVRAVGIGVTADEVRAATALPDHEVAPALGTLAHGLVGLQRLLEVLANVFTGFHQPLEDFLENLAGLVGHLL